MCKFTFNCTFDKYIAGKLVLISEPANVWVTFTVTKVVFQHSTLKYMDIGYLLTTRFSFCPSNIVDIYYRFKHPPYIAATYTPSLNMHG